MTRKKSSKSKAAASAEALESALGSLTISPSVVDTDGVQTNSPAAPMIKKKSKSTAAAAEALETARSSRTVSSSIADTDGVHLDTPTSAIAGDIKTGVSFFDRFPNFSANNAAPIQDESDRLAKSQGWGKKSDEYKAQCLTCLTMEFDRYYGHLTNNNLEGWQMLCAELLPGTPLPGSVNQCKKLLSNVHVNIYDYINCKRASKPISPIFKNFFKFCHYTSRGKLFPLKAAKNNSHHRRLLENVCAGLGSRRNTD